MSNKLAGVIFIHNGISQDYCFKESIRCLTEFCDKVYVVDAGSTDGTDKAISSIVNPKIVFGRRLNSEWESQRGKEKLSYFTNIAIKAAGDDGYEYVFSLQADEILHEKSYSCVREAVETGAPAFLIKRVNLWASPYYQLNVPHERMPCSTEIIRLAKSNYRAYDDAESLEAPFSTEFLNNIVVYHMGFVRKREIHPMKIRNMQANVFEVGVDPKLEGMEIFDPYKWFSKEDLKLIDEPLPKIIQEWAKERTYE